MAEKKKYTNSDEVFKSLQKYFAVRRFETGDRVPCERKIASDMKVNRTTLRNAMQRMVQDGILNRKVGCGTYFKISPKEMQENYTKINIKCSYVEIIETRIMLEPQIAHIAALNIDTDSINKLKKMCRIKDEDYDKIEEIDINFHDYISQIAGNSMMHQMYQVISDLRRKLSDEEPEEDVSCDSYQCAVMWKEHQNKIISALEKKNSQAAYDAVKNKLETLVGLYSVLD